MLTNHQPSDNSGFSGDSFFRNWTFQFLTIVSAFTMESSITRLLTSDDSYAAAFAVSVPVAVCFAIGGAVGWWRRSSRAACVGTTVLLFGLAALLWISDFLYDFGEADEVFGYLGLGTIVGGTCGMIAFGLRNSYIRVALSIIPQLLFGAGYLTALNSMSR